MIARGIVLHSFSGVLDMAPLQLLLMLQQLPPK
jgi:hypothetical protein